MEKSVSTANERITDDLIFLILSKLPLKSLNKFLSVCKSWSLLFQNPDFMRVYSSNFISNVNSSVDDRYLLVLQNIDQSVLYGLSGEKFEKKVRLDWPHPFEWNNFNIHVIEPGSVNGVLCLYQGFKRVVLWNPATGESKIVPSSPLESFPYDEALVLFFGFGYDPLRDDYKVIRHVEFLPPEDELETDNMTEYEFTCEIYSLKSNSWRQLDVAIPFCYSHSASVEMYLDGVCHWWVEIERNNDDACLMSFDLRVETFFITPMPSYMYDHNFDAKSVQRKLVVLNECITLITVYREIGTTHVSVLGEIGEKESWIQLFVVGPLPCIEHPIGVGKKIIFFEKKDEKLAWFDLSTQKIEELNIEGGTLCSQIIAYKECPFPTPDLNK